MIKNAQGEFVVISRRNAADSGSTFFYTGKPCKYGHMSPRYVTNNGCVACFKSNYKPRRNPWTGRLIPFNNPHLWTAAHLSKAQRLALRVYLQTCIFTFLRANLDGLDFNAKVELEAAMQEIEERGTRANVDDPRYTD